MTPPTPSTGPGTGRSSWSSRRTRSSSAARARTLTRPDAGALAATRAHTHALLRDAADRVQEHPLGFGVRCDAAPRAHMLNLLRVQATDCSPGAVAAACDELQAGLTHRKAEVLDGALGARLAPALAMEGWQVEELAVMVLRRRSARQAAAGVAEQVDPALLEQTERATEAELMPDADAGLGPQLALARRRLREASTARGYVGFHANAPAGHATLLSRDGVAQVEDVVTALFARGHGVATAMVLAATADAAAEGADPIWLHADAQDWPRQLYARLGFDVVGRTWGFTRDAPPGPDRPGHPSSRTRRPPA